MAGNACGDCRSQKQEGLAKTRSLYHGGKKWPENTTKTHYITIILKTDIRVEGRPRGTTAMTLPEWTKWEKRPSPNQEAETEFGTTKFKNWKHIKVARTNSPHGRALARWPTSTRSLLSQRHLLSGFFLFFYPNKVCFVLTPTHSWNFSWVSQELGDHLTQERSWTIAGAGQPLVWKWSSDSVT